MFQVQGFGELQAKLDRVVREYPFESEQLLTKTGNKFRTHVKQITPDGGNPNKKRKLLKSYRVSKVQGYGLDLYVEFRSTAPHFHLVERGHKIVAPYTSYGVRMKRANETMKKNEGKQKTFNMKKYKKSTGGRVAGKYMVKTTALKFQNEFPKDVEKMVNKFVRELN